MIKNPCKKILEKDYISTTNNNDDGRKKWNESQPSIVRVETIRRNFRRNCWKKCR